MTERKEARLQKKYQFFREDFDNIQTAVRDVRMQCLSDRRFCSVTGAQWEGDLEAQFANKPRFEFNKVMKSVIRIFNEYRNQKIDVDFISKDGSDVDRLADTCASLYRADEQDSVADEAKDNAFEEGVTGGMGAWRLVDVYADDDEDNDRMRIAFVPIVDADKSVFFDLDAKRQDKKDAKRCYVITALSRNGYKEQYDDDPASWPVEITQCFFDWFTPDVVYIAEVYEVEEKGTVRHVYRSLTGEEESFMPEELDEEKLVELEATGWMNVRDEPTTKRRVHKYIMSGARIIEDCGYITGSYIPVIVYYGKRWFVENVERCMGQVRLAKDAQRLENMQKSVLAEISATSSREKPIVAPAQVAGHEQAWASDNIAQYPYLPLNPLTDSDGKIITTVPLAYTKVSQIPPAMVALLQLCGADMREMLGDAESAEEVKSNISGKVVELVQNRLDMQSYIYISNFAKSIQYCGTVWLSKAKELYSEAGRTMRGISAQGNAQAIEIKKPSFDDAGTFAYENDLSKALLDVVVAVGPSSQSKRQATVRALTSMMSITQDPQDLKVLSAMCMMNMEGEGIEDVNDYYRRQLLMMGVLKPTPEEAQELEAQKQAAANAPPSPNDQFLLSEAQKNQAQTGKTIAETDLTMAKTVQTRESIRQKDVSLIIDAEQADANIAVEQARSLRDDETARRENAQP